MNCRESGLVSIFGHVIREGFRYLLLAGWQNYILVPFKFKQLISNHTTNLLLLISHTGFRSIPNQKEILSVPYHFNSARSENPVLSALKFAAACIAAAEPAAKLTELYFRFLSNRMGYDRGDSFPFDFLNQM